MIRKLRARRIGKASVYRADKELRLEALGQKADLPVKRSDIGSTPITDRRAGGQP
jgi:hypothetical protein